MPHSKLVPDLVKPFGCAHPFGTLLADPHSFVLAYLALTYDWAVHHPLVMRPLFEQLSHSVGTAACLLANVSHC